jgi:hypothetical protein
VKWWLKSRHADIAFEDINAALRESVPELKDAVAGTYEYAAPEDPGPHTLYDEALNPRINRLLDAGTESDEALERVFAFIERLSSSTDKNVRDVVLATVLPNLIGEPRLVLARRYMGPATRRLLKQAQR